MARPLSLQPLILACFAALPLAISQEAALQPIIINSAFSNIDYRTNTAVFKDIAVSQGDTHLTAERASAKGVGFTNSEWTFASGVVIVWEPHGTLRADQVIVQFSNGEVTGGTAIGSPAYFEQQPTDADRPVRGHADRITYDAKQDTVHLYGHAQLSNGHNMEMSASVLVYSFRDERLQAESPDEKRGIHTTITPN